MDRQCRRNRRKKEAMIIKKFVSKPTQVSAVQITEENMVEVAKWCRGEILTARIKNEDGSGEFIDQKYIKTGINRVPAKQVKKGLPGAWVVQRGPSFIVYTDYSFCNSFVDDPSSIPMNKSDEEQIMEGSVFQSMVSALESPRETHLQVGPVIREFVTPPAGVPMRGSGGPNTGTFMVPKDESAMTDQERDEYYARLEAKAREINGGDGAIIAVFQEPK